MNDTPDRCENDNQGHPRVALDRRRFLSGLAALGTSALTTQHTAQAQAANRIDVHHHILPPKYMAELVKLVPEEKLQPWWKPALSIEDMDKNRIATAITSLTQPSVWFGDAALARRLARESNDYAAGLMKDHPRRFRMFGTLPLPDTDGSLREAEYSLDTLKADGIVLMTSYGEKYLGDAAFWPVYEELNRRKAVIYTHPLTPACCKNPLPQYVRDSSIELGTDTTRTIASLLFNGTAARFPDIRWIFSHAGGTMPFLYGRFAREEAALKEPKAVLPHGCSMKSRSFTTTLPRLRRRGHSRTCCRWSRSRRCCWATIRRAPPPRWSAGWQNTASVQTTSSRSSAAMHAA